MSYIQGSAFNDHGELARWLENEPVIFMLDKQCSSKDVLRLTASELFSRLARGHFARAVEAPDLLPCPFCGAKPRPAIIPGDWSIWHADGCYWSARHGQGSYIEAEHVEGYNRRAPCLTCADNAKTTAEVDAYRRDRDQWREAYDKTVELYQETLARAEAAEAEVARWQDSHRAVVKQRDETEARLAALRSLISGDDGERAAKLQARITEGVAKIIKLHGGDRHSLDWQTLGIIATLEGSDHA